MPGLGATGLGKSLSSLPSREGLAHTMFAVGTCFNPSPRQHAPGQGEGRRQGGKVPIIFQTTLILEVIK